MTATPSHPACRTRRLRVAIVGAVSGVILVSAASCTQQQAEQQAATTSTQPQPVETTAPRESVTHDFVIPEGTTARLGSGAVTEIIPQPLEVWVGDRIRVRNDDSELFRLGIFNVRPGETVTMAFNTPGEMEGTIYSDQSGCGAPPADAPTFVIDVRDGSESSAEPDA